MTRLPPCAVAARSWGGSSLSGAVWGPGHSRSGADPLLAGADVFRAAGPSRTHRVRGRLLATLGQGQVLIASVAGETATIRNIGGFGEDSVGYGVGTALLQFAEEVLAAQGVRAVSGWLAAADVGHRDRQVRFCVKNGYQVRLTGQTGGVSKSLESSPWVRNDGPGRR